MQQATSVLFWTLHGNKSSLFVTKTNQANNNRKYANLFQDMVHFKQYSSKNV